MIGTVIVMEPAAYQAWLAGQIRRRAAPPSRVAAVPVLRLRRLPRPARPTLAGLYMSLVKLDDGQHRHRR